MRWQTVSAIGTFTALTSASADYLLLDPRQCKRSRTLRTTVYDKAGADGVLPFPPKYGNEIWTLGGAIVVTSSGTEAGYVAAADTLIAALETALDAMRAAPDAVVDSVGSRDMWLYAPLEDYSNDAAPIQKLVTFSLLAD